MDNSKAIIITTINPPSDAVKQFAALKDYSLFVAGDAKTPKDWECPDTRYISLQEQLDKWPDFANVVPLIPILARCSRTWRHLNRVSSI